jgi:hypothetical protein
MQNVAITILNAPDNASQTGAAITCLNAVQGSFIPVCGDTTAAGTLKIQASNDFSANGFLGPFTPSAWADIPNATSTIASGVGPAIVIPQMAFQYIRAVYTSTGGGSTTIQVRASLFTA